MSNIGIKGSAFLWIESYLTGRTAQVKIKNYVSADFDVPSGAPQGSHRGPLLFILFINDIVAVIRHSKLLIFADDAKMYKRIKSEKDLDDLQSDINSLVNWSKLNAFDLNIGKCHIISFHKFKSQFIDKHVYKISDVQIYRVNSIKDLGVYLDSNLKYLGQFDYICSKALRNFGFLKKFTFHFKNCFVIIHLYKSLILPILLHVSSIWPPYLGNEVKRLEQAQHKFSCYLAFKSGRPLHLHDHENSGLMQKFKLPSLCHLFEK